jgi:hypothetical protein
MSKETRWNTNDSVRAHRNGWDVFYVGSGKCEIQRLDEGVIYFFSDANAIEHVLQHAKSSKLCRKAIKTVYGF